ncbi:DUF2125 domain-containing protein [Roseovarius ramblicola]|uniref:DUF2125 domain-containing protein n=1 Tax=Roseovarius ramblicola TaxID=2022336 RepID=A0ABV5HXK5_9RHOB
MPCLRAAPLLFLGLFAGPALADLTAADVWQDWQGQISHYGYEITGTPQEGGDRIVIPDLGLTQDLPDDGGRIDMRMGRIELRETGDGTVEVIYPPTMPMAVAITPDDDEPLTAVLTLSHEDLSITASGTPEEIDYEYAARSARVGIGEVTIGGAPVESLTGALSFEDLEGTSTMRMVEGARRIAQSLSSGPVSYMFNVVDDETGSVLDVAGDARTMRHESRVRLPEGVDLSDMAAALDAGFRVDSDLVLGTGTGRFEFAGDGERIAGNAQGERVSINGSLSRDGLIYESETEGLAVTTETDMFPMPLSYAIERAFARLDLPVSKGEALQDFGLSVDFAGLDLPEALWSLIDPEATLPRDPAHLAVDLTGTARLTTNIFDEAEIAALEESGESPGDLDSLALEKLAFSVAGARLTGEGAIEIGKAEGLDMPPAEGTVDLRLEGGEGLLQKLVDIGLVPEDQAMTARMMASMFANAVEGEDTLTSRIEIEKDGTVTVNGQRMR